MQSLLQKALEIYYSCFILSFTHLGDKKSKQKSRAKTFEQAKQQQEAQNALSNTQAMKKDRESFRKALVDIIM